MAHQKHAKLTRPDLGHIHQNEFALLGAPCSRIQRLVDSICHELKSQYRLGYVDADHQNADSPHEGITYGAHLTYTNKINFHRWDQHREPTEFELRAVFREVELMLINGNHFQGQRQLLVLDERKFDSLRRKIDRLTRVALIIPTPEVQQIPEFLQEAIPNWDQIPRIPIDDHAGIARFLSQQTEQARPPLNGLVLAGGQSTRMGADKGSLRYRNDQKQRDAIYDLLDQHCVETYMSCRPEQTEELADYPTLPDRFAGLGPFGAILTAFQHQPDAAWLVVACDLPFVNQQTLQTLIEHRDSARTATAFHNPDSGFPEPLITIWEPRAYAELFRFLSFGYSCPRKVLINTDTHEIPATDSNWIRNINTPEEFAQAKKELEKR